MEKDNVQPFVSVLTPVYNGEKYIAACIESVLAQTYKNFEYVIVNNKSTDSTSAIIESYAGKDPRIRIQHNDIHLTLKDNLNSSFRYISGDSKYCKVLHADDLLFPECLEKMVESAGKYPTAGIICSYRLANDVVVPSVLPYPTHYISGREVCREYLLGGYCYFGAPSAILIRSDLIRKREEIYDPSYLNSDYGSCLDMLAESDLAFVHQILTFRREHNESVTVNEAMKFSTHMIGDIKMVLIYGPRFLNDAEYKERLGHAVKVFYIQFARNILNHGFSDVYKRHKAEIDSVELPFSRTRLFFNIIRDSMIRLLQIFGLRLSRYPEVDSKRHRYKP